MKDLHLLNIMHSKNFNNATVSRMQMDLNRSLSSSLLLTSVFFFKFISNYIKVRPLCRRKTEPFSKTDDRWFSSNLRNFWGILFKIIGLTPSLYGVRNLRFGGASDLLKMDIKVETIILNLGLTDYQFPFFFFKMKRFSSNQMNQTN